MRSFRNGKFKKNSNIKKFIFRKNLAINAFI